MFNDLALALGTVTILVVIVLIYMAISQRRLKANVQRIKEDFGQPGDRDMTLAQAVESSLDEPPLQDGGRELLSQLDAKTALANQLLRAADERIARLETAIARAEQLGAALDQSGPGHEKPADG